MEKQYCIVLTTFENEEQAKEIIDGALESNLAACIQVLKIKSHYKWDGKVCHDDEVLVLFKTSSSVYVALKEYLINNHPYDTPEVLMLDVGDGTDSYLKWVDEMTAH